jgi:hypothetical protein
MAGMPPQFMKKGSAAEDKMDGGMDDAQESPIPKNPKAKGKGKMPPGLQAAIARKLQAK